MKPDYNVPKEEQGQFVEVWEDIVSIKDLILALIICAITTLGAYLIAPDEGSKPLFFGLIGALVGFVICSFLIKPKRIFQQPEKDEM